MTTQRQLMRRDFNGKVFELCVYVTATIPEPSIDEQMKSQLIVSLPCWTGQK